MFLLLCKPAMIPPPYVGIDYCRVVEVRPTVVALTYEVTVLDAPKIYMDASGEDSVTSSGFFNTIASSSRGASGKSTSFKPFD